MIQCRFVVVSGRHRLHFKLYGFEADQIESFAKASLRKRVVLIAARSNEVNGTADQRRVDANAELQFPFPAKIQQYPGN